MITWGKDGAEPIMKLTLFSPPPASLVLRDTGYRDCSETKMALSPSQSFIGDSHLGILPSVEDQPGKRHGLWWRKINLGEASPRCEVLGTKPCLGRAF